MTTQKVQKFQDLRAVQPSAYNGNKKKYLITDEELVNIPDYEKISTIDQIQEKDIGNYHYFLFFHGDDEYLYHIDKIIKNGGTFSVHQCADKTNYVHSNHYARLALNDTLNRIDEISHYNENIHGNICQAIDQTKDLEGVYLEVGVYKGGSALTALNYMHYAGIHRKSYFINTFDGFNYTEAEKSSDIFWNNTHKLWGEQETMKRIDNLLRTSKPDQDFKLIKSNICSDKLSPEIDKIAVANIDVDMYDATRDALSKVAERIVDGGIMIAEDPTSTPFLIGAFYALSEFLKTPLGGKFMKIHVTGQYLLIKVK
jgi:hypothetical protein